MDQPITDPSSGSSFDFWLLTFDFWLWLWPWPWPWAWQLTAFSHVLWPKWRKAQLLSKFQSFPENSNKLFKFLKLWMHSCSLKVYISMGWTKGKEESKWAELTARPHNHVKLHFLSHHKLTPCFFINLELTLGLLGSWQIWLTVASVKVFSVSLFFCLGIPHINLFYLNTQNAL